MSGRDRGSVAVEAAIIAPAVLAFVMIAVVSGRIQTTGGVIDAAARAGARAASLQRAPDKRVEEAEKAARGVFESEQVPCSKMAVEKVGTTKLQTPTGDLETITVTVKCEVTLDFLLVPGAPGVRTMRSTFSSVIDKYRGEG